MLKFSACVEYGRNGIYFTIKMCMFVESMYNPELSEVSGIQM